MNILSQQFIVNVLRCTYEDALKNHMTAVSERAAAIAGANAWDDYHKDDGVGGFSQNPYNLNHVDNKVEQCRVALAHAKQALDLAVDTFLNTKQPREIKIAFDALVKQRDESPTGSTARDTTNQRALALAWVLNHPEVPNIVMEAQSLELYKCLS